MAAVDFYVAQSNVGESYFVYAIQDGKHTGGAVSCYFWYSSPDQFFFSLIAHGDFWQWSEEWDVVSIAIKEIVESSSDPETIMNTLSAYLVKNAGVSLYAWGEFDELLSGDNPFCVNVRAEFRENRWVVDEEEPKDEADPSRAISSDEVEAFCEYLAETPA